MLGWAKTTRIKSQAQSCSLPKGVTPEEITPVQASRYCSRCRVNWATAFQGQYRKVRHLSSKQGNKSKSLYGNDNIFNITLERAEELLTGAPEKSPAQVIGTHP